MSDDYGRDGDGGFPRRLAMRAIGSAGTAALFGGSLSAGERTQSTWSSGDQSPRNLVFVLSDDHRYDFMSFLDERGTPTFLETPYMDRMAKRGAHLSNAFVGTSLCAPSRATVLTGRYAHQHGILNNQSPMPKLEDTFPERLQKLGYETAFIGKWHMYDDEHADPRRGFDHWVSFPGQGQYFEQPFNVNGKRVQREGYITDQLTQYALEWLRNRDGDRPFCLFLSHKAPHHPWRPAPRHRNRYDDEPIDRPKTMDETKGGPGGKPEWVAKQRNSPLGVGGKSNFEEMYRRYAETLLSLDESIGAVMNALNQNDLADSTFMLYMGDNGFLLGEHGLIDKRVAYEPSIRIPMLAYAPGLIEPGTEVTDLISNVDVAPTFLDAAGRSADETDGRSFLPLLTGNEAPKWRDALLYEYFWSKRFPPPPTVFTLRTKRYKYVTSYGRWDNDELYDLKRDPREQRNLADADQHGDRISRMHKRLFDLLEETGGTAIPLQR